jgi:Bacterial SH3 domain
VNSREPVVVRFFTLRLAVVAGVLAPLMVADAQARDGAFRRVITIGQTGLRKAPRTDGEILTVIPKGTTVAAGDCRGGWCRVSWHGQSGYAVDHDLGFAETLQWPNAPMIAWPGTYGSLQKAGTTARERDGGKENKDNDAGDSGPEHSLILEIGTAGEWPVNGERPNFGGTFAAEIEPIENWLELEFGLSTLATAGHTELSGDLLFKKPFRLSSTSEFMIGAGPSYSHTLNGPERGGVWSVELALDWMFWPTRNMGWFIEPTWSVNPRNGQRSAGISVGMLFGFPK